MSASIETIQPSKEPPFHGSTFPPPSQDPVSYCRELRADPFLLELQSLFAEFFEGVGFKANLGRIWAVLLYTTQPLSQKEMMTILGLSSGMISQGVNELSRLGMVECEQDATRGRENRYSAERNLTKALSSVLTRREEVIVDRLSERVLSLKARMAVSQQESSSMNLRLQQLEQVLTLCRLAKSIIEMIEMFSHYSYHVVQMGSRALARLKIPELPKW